MRKPIPFTNTITEPNRAIIALLYYSLSDSMALLLTCTVARGPVCVRCSAEHLFSILFCVLLAAAHVTKQISEHFVNLYYYILFEQIVNYF